MVPPLSSSKDLPILIVGASTAGLYAAGLLASAGRQVQVLERAPALDPTPRSLIATARIQPFLDVAGAAESKVAEVSDYELFAGSASADVPLALNDIVVERARLLQDLAAWARAGGAEIIFGTRVERLEPRGDKIVCHQQGGPPIVASAVVGADGVSSAVAKSAGWQDVSNAPLVQAIVDWPKDVPSSTSQVWFRPTETTYFFWLIPDGEGRGAVGVIGNAGNATRRSLDQFLDERGLTPLEYQAARVALYRPRRKLHKKLDRSPVWLVGDAAGHVKVSTVGGLVTGFRGAEAVASSLTGASPRKQLGELRRELGTHLFVRRMLDRFGAEDYARLLGLLDAATSKRVGMPTRDEGVKVLVSALRARPSIALLVARALLSRPATRPPVGRRVPDPT